MDLQDVCRPLSKTITYSCSNTISIESPVSIMGLDIPLEYSNVVEVHSKEGTPSYTKNLHHWPQALTFPASAELFFRVENL